MNRTLRIIRIVVAVAVWVILSLMLSVSALTLPVVRPFLLKAQIGTAVATLTVFTFVVWMIITLLFGRVYCSTLCPLGTLQDIIARLAGYGRTAEGKRRYRWAPPRHLPRLGMLALWIALLAAGASHVASLLDPMADYGHICRGIGSPLARSVEWMASLAGLPVGQVATIFTESAAATALAFSILIGVAAAAASGGRILCNTVCPVGTMLGMVSRFSVFQMDINTDLCVNCRKCEDVCKGQCINLNDHVVDGSRCVNCFDCVSVCPNGAMRYTSRRHRLSTPLMQRVTTLAREQGAALGNGSCAATPASEPHASEIEKENIR